MTPIRILLADDHELVRAGILSLMKNFDAIEVVAEAKDGPEAVERIITHQPDVALVDLHMPNLNGLEVLRKVLWESPKVRVIILSIDSSQPMVVCAMQAGAAGYLMKSISLSELELAIHAVVRGETYLHSAISHHLVSGLSQRNPDAELLEKLSGRQFEILKLMAESGSTKSIAKRLSLSIKTVEMHRGNLMKVLGIHDVAGLVRFAIRVRIISPAFCEPGLVPLPS